MKIDVKSILADSFESLLLEKPFDAITVTDITNHCGAARSTFYKHFSDKYDVMIWKYHKALNAIHTDEKGVDDWREGTLAGVRYLAENRKYFLKVLDYKGQNNVHEFLYSFALEYTQKIMCKKLQCESLPTIENEAVKVYLMGTSRYIMEWLKTMHMSPEELADLLCDCMPENLRVHFE